MNEPAVLTVAEMANILRISPAYTYILIEKGELPSLRLGRRIVVPRKALYKLIEAEGIAETGAVS